MPTSPAHGSGRLLVRDIRKQYRKRVVVQGASMDVSPGEVVGLLGPNGAGKTTCFYMVVGLIQSDAGSIMLDGRDITDLPMHARARLGIGYLPQEPSVFRKLSVRDNILAILELRSELGRQQRYQQCARLMDEFSIAHLCDQSGISLSGGERRRVEIARALAAAPRFILLDEPFAGVDPISVIEIQTIIRQLAERRIGVLITDHNVRETLNICQRAYILSDGGVIADGAPEEILTNRQVRQVYLGDAFRM
jgi:lipopolysaccharide export system ATP-binding protein